MRIDEICQKYKRKHGDALSCQEPFLAMQFYTKLLKMKKGIFQKRFTCVACKMVSVILNSL